MPRRVEIASLALVLIVTACGDDAAPPLPMEDAGTDAGPPPAVQVLPPAEPAVAADPAPRVPGACPDGWLTAADGESCTPYADDARPSSCDAFMFQPPGEGACVTVGSACPAGDFPDEIPSGSPVVYVLASASAGGVGTRESPFATITEGLTAVDGGGVVVVGKGTYTEALRVPSGVTIVGACAAEVLVDPPDFRVQSVVVQGADVVLRGMQVTSAGDALFASGAGASFIAEGLVLGPVSRRLVSLTDGAHAMLRGCAMRDGLAGVVAETGASIAVERSVIERTYDAAVGTTEEGTRITLDGVRVGETRRTTGTLVNAAIAAQTSSLIEVRGSVVSSSARTAIKAQTAGVVSLTDSLVDDVLGVSTADGYGLEASFAGIVRGERVRVEDAAGAAVLVTGAGSECNLIDSVLRGSASPDGPENDSEGAFIRSEGRLVMERSRVEGFRTGGIAVLDEGATFVATDVVVREMLGTLDGLAGRGIEVGRGGRAELLRVRIERVREVGVLATDAGSSVLAEDLAIVGTREQASDLHSGRAMQLQQGAVAELVRARFEDNLDLVLSVRDPATVASVSDLVIERVGEDVGEGRYGRAIEVILGAQMRLTRARIAEATEVSLVVADEGTELDAEDVVIVATRSGAASTAFGRGIEVMSAGRVTLARAVLDGNRDAALLASGVGTTVELVDVDVRDTMATACAEACVEGVSGLGIGAIAGASIEARRFIVRDQAALGVQVADGASLDLQDGQVSGCPIGANVAIEGYDVRRVLAPDVVFRDNQRDLSLDPIGTLVPLPRRD